MLIILSRVILSALTMFFQKKLTLKHVHPVFILSATYAAIFLAFLPSFFLVPFHWTFTGIFLILLASLLDLSGNLFLFKSLSITELSIYGPINAFKPAVAILIAIIISREFPDIKGVFGVIVIIAGSVLLTFNWKKKQILNWKGLAMRIAGIILTSMGAVFTREALRWIGPQHFFMLWALFSIPFIIGLLLVRYLSRIIPEFRGMAVHWIYSLLAVLTYLGMQFFTILTFQKTMVGYALALFQLSSVITVIIGVIFLQEKKLIQKSIASLVMIGGAFLILF